MYHFNKPPHTETQNRKSKKKMITPKNLPYRFKPVRLNARKLHEPDSKTRNPESPSFSIGWKSGSSPIAKIKTLINLQLNPDQIKQSIPPFLNQINDSIGSTFSLQNLVIIKSNRTDPLLYPLTTTKINPRFSKTKLFFFNPLIQQNQQTQ